MSKVVFFSADDGVHGDELWVTDGTPAGTRMVRDINTDNNIIDVFRGSNPQDIADLGDGRVIFRARDDIFGGRDELWASDGTPEGTGLVRNIGGGINSEPGAMTQVFPGLAVFHADDGVHGRELWVTDGTYDGTRLIADINSGAGDAFDPIRFENFDRIEENFVSLGFGRIVFSANDGVHGRELWVTDGTEAGTRLLKDILPGDGSGLETGVDKIMAVGNGKAIFSADNGVDGKELWVTDGTAEGTKLLRDLATGSSDGDPRDFRPLPSGQIEGTYDSGGAFDETFTTDGTVAGTVINAESPLTDIAEPFPPTSNTVYGLADYDTRGVQLANGLKVFEGDYYVEYVGDDDIFNRQELDVVSITDGTKGGTEPIGGFFSDSIARYYTDGFDGLTGRGGDFYALPDGRAMYIGNERFADFSFGETKLFVTDGTSVSSISSEVKNITAVTQFSNGQTFFLGNTKFGDALGGPLETRGLWVTDGLSAQNIMEDLHGYSLIKTDLGSDKWLLKVTRDFIDSDNDGWEEPVDELWVTDGTKSGTRMVMEDFQSQNLRDIVSLNENQVIVTYYESDSGTSVEPWVVNLNGGAQLLSDIRPGLESSNPDFLTQMVPQGEIPVPVSTLFDEKVSLEEVPASFDLDDYFEDPADTTLSYTVSGTPDEITVDPAENVIEATEGALPGSYTVDVTARNLLGGETTDSFDWTVVDTGVLKIVSDGDWGRETPGGPILSTPGSILKIGRKDGTEALFRVEPRDAATPVASIEDGKITLDGNIFSEQVTTTKPLMQGGFTIDMATAAVTDFNDADIATDHRLVADLIDLKFDNVAIEADKITFNTDLAFGDSTGGGPAYSALSTSGAPLSVGFGADGLEFGLAGGAERWSPEPVEFDLGGGSSISIGFSDLGVDYDSPSDSVYLSGKATVGWGGEIENGFDFLDNESEQSLVIDLAGEAQAGNYFQRGDKFLKIKNGTEGWDWDVVGEIKYEDKYEGEVPSNGLLVKELGVSFDTVQDAYSGNFKANIPLFFGLDLSADLGFVTNPDLALDSIGFGVDGLDYPVGTTGLFVQGGSFGLENLAAADPDAGWTYDADITGTFGPDNDLVSSPLHGKIAGTVKETLQQGAIGYILNGSIELDSKVGYFLPDIVTNLATPLIDYFGVEPEEVTEFEILTATSSTELDFTKDLAQLDAAINLLDGVVNGAAQLLDAPFGSEKDVRKITGSVDATLTIPEAFPLVGGMTRSGNAKVVYTSDGDFNNDVAAFWGSISLPFGYVRQVGAELTFNGDYQFLGRKEIAKTSSWELDESNDLVILSARWEIAADDVAIELIAPDGTVLTESDIAARADIALVADLNTEQARHVALQNPETGIWDLRVADDSGLGEVRYEASEILESAAAPIESLTHDPATDQTEIVINLEAGDAETVDVVIFAAPDPGRVAGVELDTITMNAGDPDVTHVIDHGALGPGDWHIYTRTEADGLVPGIEMHSAPITIAGAADLGTSVQQAKHTATGQQILTIDVTNDGDRPSQAGSLAIDVPTGMLGADPIPEHDAEPLEETQSQLELPPLAPGETFTVHIALPEGSEDLDDAIFVEAWTPGYDADRTDNALGQGLLTDVNHIPAGTVTLTAPVELGATVGVDLSGLIEPDDYDPDSINYQWLRDGVGIAGATDATHDVTSDDVGQTLSVRLDYTDDKGTQEQVISAGAFAAGAPQMLTGTPRADVLAGDNGHDTIRGLESNDTLTGDTGNDSLDGGSGVDTALYSGDQSSYTLTISPTATTIADRRADGNGTDTLVDMELLDFDTDLFGAPFDLAKFAGPAGLSQDDFESFIELYIAYFNRAPDAVGLTFWGTAFATGTSLEEMATLFVDQPETEAAYPPGTSNEDFAEAVYNNVLGRTPDQLGFDFWVGQLDDENVSRDQFILEVLRGAKADPPPDADQAFIDQQQADRAYLSDKVDIGAYFAVHKGMSDVTNAADAMAFFDGTEASIGDAVSAIEGFHADALDPDTGEFMMPLIGVLDDPFAGG